MPTNTGYRLIPMDQISDEAREIAVLWAEGNGYEWIGDKHKLASDIENYARKYCAYQLERIKAGLDKMILEQK